MNPHAVKTAFTVSIDFSYKTYILHGCDSHVSFV